MSISRLRRNRNSVTVVVNLRFILIMFNVVVAHIGRKWRLPVVVVILVILFNQSSIFTRPSFLNFLPAIIPTTKQRIQIITSSLRQKSGDILPKKESSIIQNHIIISFEFPPHLSQCLSLRYFASHVSHSILSQHPQSSVGSPSQRFFQTVNQLYSVITSP